MASWIYSSCRIACFPPPQGRLTLLLGPPGAGKSTLLRVLSGQLKDKELQLKGDVTYNGVWMKDFVVERTAAYVDQVGGGSERSAFAF